MLAWLGLGSNLGDRPALIAEAVRRFDRLPRTRVVVRSALYETAPWGEPDQPDFLNAAVAVETSLAPHALLDACLAIERDLGRVRERRWGPRVIDIDLLAYQGVVVDDSRLTLPHPHLLQRAFALLPLAEIAPDLVVNGKPIRAAAAEADSSGIRRWEGEAA